MPVYDFVAIDETNAKQKGVLAGDSPRQVRDELRQQGLSVVSLNPKQSESHSDSQGIRIPFAGRNVSDVQLTNFISELATLLAVDIPILEALETQIAQAKGKFKNSLMLLKDEIASGSGLADAMKNQPSTFDFLSVNMVEVGERSGNLESVLARLSEFKQRASQFKDRVLSALIYPMIVLGVALIVAVFLMTYVVPTLLDDLVEAGRQLPLPTAVLKSVSDSLVQHGWIYGSFAVAALIMLWGFLQTPVGTRLWYRLMLCLPVIGKMSMKQELSRISLVISTLMKSGLPFIASADVAIRTSKNVLLRENMKKCRNAVETGKDIGDALDDVDFFPPLFVHVFSVGQKAGRLEEMLEKLSEDYNRQVEVVSARLSMILEPVLILGLSIFIGFLLFATMLPILEAGNVQ